MMPLAASARLNADNVLALWEKANLPTKPFRTIAALRTKLNAEFPLLKKNHKRGGDAQQRREICFMLTLEKLFDVSHHQIDGMVKIEEGLQFLLIKEEVES